MRSQFVSFHALMHSNTHDRSTGNTEGVASRIAAKIGADKKGRMLRRPPKVVTG